LSLADYVLLTSGHFYFFLQKMNFLISLDKDL
jgi:hypothetical protein